MLFRCPSQKKPALNPEEQQVLEQLQAVLLEEPSDRDRCDELIAEHHYLKDANPGGRTPAGPRGG